MAKPIVTVIGTEEVIALTRNLPRAWFKEVKAEYRGVAARVHKDVSNRVRDGRGDTLHSRTGQLRRSLVMKVHGNSFKTLGSEVYSSRATAAYAPIHEFGGTIKAKRAYARVPGGPYLNIPLSSNYTPAGVMRQSARDVFSQGGFIIKSKKGKYLVMSGAGIPMFVLVKSVVIPARLRMYKTAEEAIPTLLQKLSDATSQAIKKADK